MNHLLAFLLLSSFAFAQSPNARLGERDDFPTFTRELVRVEWRPKDPIYLYVMLPKLVRKPAVILYLYNYDTDTNRFLNEKFAAQLVEGGVAAVGFSSALSGQRYHDRPMSEWFVSDLNEALTTTVQDVHRIIDYLEHRGDVDASRVGMFGEASGAAISVLAASADRRIKALDLLNLWGDWPDWLAHSAVVPDEERGGFTTKAFLDGVSGSDPVQFLPKLTIPIRLQYMADGGATPDKAKMCLEAAAPPQTLKIPSDKALAEYSATSGKDFLSWIKARLQ